MASRLVVEILSDAKGFSKGLDSARKDLDGFSKKVDQSNTTFGKLKSRFDNLGASSKIAMAAAGSAFIAFANDSARAASDLEESVNAVNKIFGESSDTILEFSKVAAQAAGLSRSEFNQLATQTGGLLQNFGFSAQEAANQAIRLTQRASDLASVFNTDVPRAVSAINAALRGETEPLRFFNISLSDAAIRAKAVELGLADTTSAVDQNGKAVAALELIYEQSSAAQGDFIQTSQDAANAQRVLAAEFENTKASFGTAVLPAKNFFTRAASDLLGVVNLLGVFGDDAKEAQQQAFLLEDAFYGISQAAQQGEDVFTALADGLFHIAENGDLTTAQFEALAAAAGLGTDQFEDFLDIVVAQARALGKSEEDIAEFEAAIRGTGSAAQAAGPAVEDLGGSIKGTGDQANIAEQSLKSLADQMRAQTQPVFGALRAWQQYRDTINQIDEDGQRTSEELVTLAESAIDVVGAFGELSATDLDQAFESIGRSIGTTADKARDLFRELGLFDGRQFSFQVTGTYETSGSPGGDLGITLPRGIEFRAMGGPVSAGSMYLVGERGPELFVPSRGGTIVPGGSAANTTVVFNNSFNISETTSPVAARRIINELDRQLVRLAKERA